MFKVKILPVVRQSSTKESFLKGKDREKWPTQDYGSVLWVKSLKAEKLLI